MAINATLYNFGKKVNSTERPAGGLDVECNLRDGSDQFSPNLEIRGISVPGYNYMYIPLFGRYYYIDKCTWSAEQNFWIVSGSCDVLATFRGSILNSAQYITRCSGAVDVSVYDEKAVATARTRSIATPVSLPFAVTRAFSNSCVICNIIGEGLVAMSGSSYNSMMRNFLTVNDPINLNQYWTQDIARNLTNPAQYILSAMCVPIPYLPYGSDPGHNPRFGWYTTPNTVYFIQDQYVTFEAHVLPLLHPDSREENDYVNKPPFVSRSLYVSGIGLIQLDDSKINPMVNLDISFTIDYVTGGIVVRVRSAGVIVGYATGQIGYTLAVTQAHSPDMVSAIGGTLMGSVFGGAQGGLMGAAAGAGSGILKSLGQGTSISVHGSTGGAGAWIEEGRSSISLVQEFKDVKGIFIGRQGQPLYQAHLLSDFEGGYVEVDKPAVDMVGNETEKIKVSQYLQGGVYLE